MSGPSRLSFFHSVSRSACVHLPACPCGRPLSGSPQVPLGTLAQGLCVIRLLQSSWFCILGGTWWPGCLPSVARRWVWGCPAPAYTQGDMSDGAFGPGSGLSRASGSSSSRGAFICFAVAPAAASIVTLPGDRVASAALVTCVPLAPPATEDTVHGLGLLQVLGPLGGGSRSPGAVGREVASAVLGKGRGEGGDAVF